MRAADASPGVAFVGGIVGRLSPASGNARHIRRLLAGLGGWSLRLTLAAPLCLPRPVAGKSSLGPHQKLVARHAVQIGGRASGPFGLR